MTRAASDNNKKSVFNKSEGAKGTGVNKVKSQIRSLKRLLERADLDDEQKVLKTQQLAELEDTLGDKSLQNVAVVNKSKSKQVIFYEKKKITSQLEKLKSQLAVMLVQLDTAPTEEEVSLRLQLAQKERELLYVNNFPFETNYVPLFGTKANQHSKRSEEIMKRILRDSKYQAPTYRVSTTDFDKHIFSDSEDDDDEVKTKTVKSQPIRVHKEQDYDSSDSDEE